MIPLLLVAAALRLYGLVWDGGHWLQPDERQIYFVTVGLGWPHSLPEAAGPGSPLNPGFFAYGSLVFYLLKLFAAAVALVWPAVRDPDNLHLAGRLLAVLADMGTVALTYRLARVLGHPVPGAVDGGRGVRRRAVVAAGLVSVAVLSIELAHFYTADVLLTFFVMLALNLAIDAGGKGGTGRAIALGAAVGLALATKVSAAPLLIVVVAAHGLTRDRGGSAVRREEAVKAAATVMRGGSDGDGSGRAKKASAAAMGEVGGLRPIALSLGAAALVFVLTQPYTVIDWPTFVADTLRESRIAWGRLDVPYTRQYAGTLPYLFSTWQTTLWGLGLPLGLAAWAGLAGLLVRWLRWGGRIDRVLLAWAGPYVAITGLLYAKPLRYLLPAVPVLCLLAVDGVARIRRARIRAGAYGLIVSGTVVYALAFTSIYAAPHPWIAASEWIYRQVPSGSVLAVEEWDTALPLPLAVEGRERRIEEYEVQALALYDEPDNAAKWQALAEQLAGSDYIVVASRRIYGSVSRLPERYPLAGGYYQLLFAGKVGFELAGEFTRGPAWLNPRVPPLPGAAPAVLRPDESFVVYDHPRAMVFRNTGQLSPEDLLQLVDPPPP